MPDIPKVRDYVQTCHACPSQWEATLDDGRFAYLRYRWGCFGYGIGATEDEAVENCTYVDDPGDRFDGFLTDERMRVLAAPYLDFSTASPRVDKVTP